MTGQGLGAQHDQHGPFHDDPGEDLIRIVASLARDVEQLDALISSQRRLLAQAGPVRASESERARQQWNRIRANAAEIAGRAREALEEVTPPAVNN